MSIAGSSRQNNTVAIRYSNMLHACLRPFRRTLLLAAAASLPIAYSADPPAFPNNEDLRHFRSLSSPRLSPDGHRVLVEITDSTADGAKSHLWLIDIDRNTYRQLTYSPDADKSGEHAAEWMPDGEGILFLAHRGENTQLFRLPMNGGEAKAFDLKVPPQADAAKLPNALPPPKEDAAKKEEIVKKDAEPLPIDLASFEIAPDGKTIAFVAQDPKTPGEKKQSEAKADAEWVDHEIHLRRLYLLDPETAKITPVAVPVNVQHAAWAHDNTRLLVIAEEPNNMSDLGPSHSSWLVNLTDPAHPAKIADLPADIDSVAWSVDGGSIPFLAQAHHDAPPGYPDLFEYNLATHAIRNFTEGLRGSIGRQEPIALPGGSIALAAGEGFDVVMLRLRPDHGEPESLRFGTPVVGSFHTNLQHTGWVFVGSGSTQAPALYYASDLAQPARALAIPTLGPANNRSVASKRIKWTSDHLTIEGLLYLPPQSAEHKVPLIVEVHGGPTGAYVDSYVPFINFLAGHGWAVLRTNPRGSTNYGAAFAAANKNDLGGGDYRDIMAGVDYVLKTEPIDPDRLALEGYSYGGEMAGFVEVKTSRFKAIISGAPVIDQHSEYGTESGSFYDRWFYGKPWEHPEDAWRQSPLSGAAHAVTPFMLLQGEADTTDPLGQSQEMYRALRQMGVPVELITYPRDNHGPLAQGIYGAPVREPWHGFDARQRMIQFIQKAFGEGPK
jgi:dipeptidyl aminopeptidase/acylaminoacyl peptidase